MNPKQFKELIVSFQEFCRMTQRALGKKSSMVNKHNFDIGQYLQTFHAFDQYCYYMADINRMQIIDIGGAAEQMTGYTKEEFLNKGYMVSLKTHRIKDLIKSVNGGKKYFDYLYKQPQTNRPFIKVNRTMDFFCKNGKVIHVLIQSIPALFNDAMEPVYMFNIMSDITEIKTDRKYTHYIIDSSDEHDIKKIPVYNEADEIAELPQISNAEQRVLTLMAEGLSSKQIAAKLFLSEHTIKNHRKNMLQKLNCTSSAEVIKLAITNGWI